MPARVRAFCTYGRFHHIEVEASVTAYLEHANGAAGLFVTTTGEQHVGILRNFVAACRDDAALVAPAAEGIRSMELANAMLYSSAPGETVALPLDAAVYRR